MLRTPWSIFSEQNRDSLVSFQRAATHADLNVIIEGHTDGQGDDARNQALSERRAAAVVAYVTGEGVRANRLTAVGKGETAPVADNATNEGRQQNRRVVIRKRS